MEADYYIFKYLQIEHINGISYISLKHDEKYYSQFLKNVNTIFEDDNDSDNDLSTELTNKQIKIKHLEIMFTQIKYLFLKPRNPIIIYENSQFLNSNFEKKYKKLIEDKINEKVYPPIFIEYSDTGKLESFETIKKITKIETRNDPWLPED